MAKKKKDIRDLTNDQLIDQLEILKKDLFNLKIEIIYGQNSDTSKISKINKYLQDYTLTMSDLDLFLKQVLNI